MAEGVSWLLHIDADELFWVDMDKDAFAGSAAVLFEKLSSKKFTHASFMNDEILPETANYADKSFPLTPFHQRTLFKVELDMIITNILTSVIIVAIVDDNIQSRRAGDSE